ncbi:universal stress protein [Fischerella thermalis CCMEE 5330]|jgi:nucleotide-binding universal stress UspA family protein|uniref:UspA domain-containing protein n=2 Tax=Nostocales TaxID=1161 RepID=A0A2H6LKJ2_9NOSO|nr:MULTISPECIES: universal stress protein [Nostocales]PMB38065.1 universal stress protein [Fischerella thermalis CCMEE 5330]GBE93734.1 UspA domain-containing protein [Nostoc cycadae WK-1]
MFQKILVAIDCSKVSKRVFEKALALAKLTKANLMIFNVLCPEEEGYLDTADILNYYDPDKDSEAAQHSQKMLDKFSQPKLEMLRLYATEATAAGVYAEYKQDFGNPGETICEFARNWQADLIIIGRRHWLSGIEEFVLGRVSNYVLHHAFCSVLIVP